MARASGSSRAALVPQAVGENVEVADRPELAAEPLEARAQVVAPRGLERVLGGLQERAQTADRDPQVVEFLRVGAESRPRVVRQDLAHLLGQSLPEDLGLPGERLSSVGRWLSEHPEELRHEIPDPGALGGRLPDRAERLVLSLDELHLGLVEAADDPALVEDGDGVVDDLGRAAAVRDTHAFSSRLQLGDRREVAPADERGRRSAISLGGRAGPPGASISRRAAPSRELELPGPPVLDPAPQRDPDRHEPVLGSVVVGRREDAQLERLAGEVGEAKSESTSNLSSRSRTSRTG